MPQSLSAAAWHDIEREIVMRGRAAGEVSPAAADEALDDIEALAVRSAR